MAKKDGPKARSTSERFEDERTLSAVEVAGYLEGLARGLREGAVSLGDESDGFRSSVASDVEVEVEARRRKRKSRIDLKLTFRATDDANAAAGDNRKLSPRFQTI